MTKEIVKFFLAPIQEAIDDCLATRKDIIQELKTTALDAGYLECDEFWNGVGTMLSEMLKDCSALLDFDPEPKVLFCSDTMEHPLKMELEYDDLYDVLSQGKANEIQAKIVALDKFIGELEKIKQRLESNFSPETSA